MTTPKERFTDEAVAAAVAERDAAHAESVAKMANKLQNLRAELTAARTVGLENYNRACRERDEARAALAKAREALEGALKFLEREMRYTQPTIDSGEEPADQFTYDAGPICMHICSALSALKTTPTQESETP